MKKFCHICGEYYKIRPDPSKLYWCSYCWRVFMDCVLSSDVLFKTKESIAKVTPSLRIDK